MFQKQVLENTRCLTQWAGRGTRGVTQFYGQGIKALLDGDTMEISIEKAIQKLTEMIQS